MNVTIKVDDGLCRAARHRAVDEGLSLSGWIGKLLVRELSESPKNERSNLLDLLGDEQVASVELELPRFPDPPRCPGLG
jgi:hypothetical protein